MRYGLFKPVVPKPVLEAPLPCTFCMSPLHTWFIHQLVSRDRKVCLIKEIGCILYWMYCLLKWSRLIYYQLSVSLMLIQENERKSLTALDWITS